MSALLLPMTIAFGAAFPFAVAIASGRDDTVTEQLGLIYAINTLGAILGSLLAGFVLIPAIGLHLTIRIVAAVITITAIAILLRAHRGAGRSLGFALAAGAVVAIAIAPHMGSIAAVERRLQVRAGHARIEPRDRTDGRRAAVVSGGIDRHGRGAKADRHHLARDRRQGRRVERAATC